MMQALMNYPHRTLMWIMDSIFVYTPFGIVSKTHGDYFLDCYHYKTGDILKHSQKQMEYGKNLFIIFPEGESGFRIVQLLMIFN